MFLPARAWAGSPAPTTTTLTVSSTAVASGTAVKLTAKVVSGTTLVSPGKVVFCNAAAAYCEDIHILGAAQLTGSGTAAISLTLGAGSHSIQAVFQGTKSYAGSKSTTKAVSVTASTAPVGSTTTLAEAGNATGYTLTAAVTANSKTAPTGNVALVNAANPSQEFATATLGAGVVSNPFVAGPSHSLSCDSADLAKGDFNGDGKLDIANLCTNGTVQIYTGNGDGSFTAGQTISTGLTNPNLAAADLDSDGLLDLVVTADNGASFVVLKGQANATFAQLPGTFATGLSGGLRAEIASGDFNEDGVPDLVLTSLQAGAGESSVALFLGNGDGTFQPATLISIPDAIGVGMIAVADFNGDGHLDVVVATQDGPPTVALLGDGTGNFQPAQPFGAATELAFYSVVVSDINGDGKPDIVLGMYGGFDVGIGNGDGTFTLSHIPGGQLSKLLAVGDVNGDGYPDLFLGLTYPGMGVLLGSASGTFTPVQTPIQTYSNSFVMGDFNGDGLDDLVGAAANGQTGLVTAIDPPVNTATAIINNYVFFGAGNSYESVYASFAGSTHGSLQIEGSNSSAMNLYADDFTTTALSVSPGLNFAQGQSVTLTATVTPALAGTGYTPTGTVNFYDGTKLLGSAALSAGLQAAISVTSLAPGAHQVTAVYEGDSNYYNSTSAVSFVRVFKSTSATTLSIAPGMTVPLGSIVTLKATVTGGGAPVTAGTVLFCNASAAYCEDGTLYGTAQVTSAGTATLKLSLGAGAYAIKAEYVQSSAAGPSTSTAQTLTVTGLNATTTTIAESGVPGNYSFTGKVTGFGGKTRTGTLSLLDGVNSNYSSLANYAMSSGTSSLGFVRAPVPQTGPYPNLMVSGDFNGDGATDFVVANSADDSFTLLLGDGKGNFAVGPQPPNPNNLLINAIVAGDFNGDGLLDLAVSVGQYYIGGTPTKGVEILLGAGGGNFTVGQTYAFGNYIPNILAVGDFNGDGHLDIVANSSLGSGLSLMTGKGDGTFTAGDINLGYSLPAVAISSIAVGDFNGDGIADLAIADRDVNLGSSDPKAVNILPGNGDGTFGLPFLVVSSLMGNLIAGDFNRDGKTDLFGLLAGVPTLYLGNGAGAFTAAPAIPATGNTPSEIVAGDFNHDGALDLAVVGSTADKNVTVLLGNNHGAFTATPLVSTDLGPIAVAAADLNGDGSPDVAVLNQGYGTHSANDVTVLLSQVTTSFTDSGVSFVGGVPYSVKASYSGDSTYGASVSAPVTAQGVALATTTTEVVMPTTTTVGQPVQCSATVTPATTGGPALTGSVKFYTGGGQVLGTVPLVSGQASFSTSKLPVGSDPIFAVYSGDVNYLTSTSATTRITVTAP